MTIRVTGVLFPDRVVVNYFHIAPGYDNNSEKQSAVTLAERSDPPVIHVPVTPRFFVVALADT